MFYLTPLKIILKSFLPDAMYANIIVSYSKCRPLHQILCKAALSGWLAGKNHPRDALVFFLQVLH